MARLQLDRLTKRYGDFAATRDVTLTVEEGELVVLLGPSGCGKTTTLRMVAGFVEPTSGTVHLGGQDVTGLPPWRRNTGLVFQSYALFPHMSVNQNVAFALDMRKVPASEAKVKVHEALALVRLDHLGDRLPRQLSGGQQQRVALARALVFRPDILLLDEPLSNLDAKLREEVRIEIRNLQRELGITTVMVTHDQEEALTIADRLVVMNAGEVHQIGNQRDLYERPADRFVAEFVGRGSFLEGAMQAPGAFRTAGGLDIACEHRGQGAAVLGLRPERVTVAPLEPPASASPAAGHGGNRFEATVEFVSYLGGLVELKCRLSAADVVVAQAVNPGGVDFPEIGDRVVVEWPVAAAFVFPHEQTAGTEVET